jgi:hypothetical protein
MVNIGKPSGGCKLCLFRRIKCDETKPFCLRCKKSKRECPGYRDPLEPTIKDETQATIRRFMRLKNKRASIDSTRRTVSTMELVPTAHELRIERPVTIDFAPTVVSTAFAYEDDTTESEESFDRPECIPRSLLISTEEQAACFFLSDFTLVPKLSTCNMGHLKFIPTLLSRGVVSARLGESFKAISLASMATRPRFNAQNLMVPARSHYVKAVREVSNAIQDPVLQRDDETLAAVLLLAFYEVLADFRQIFFFFPSDIECKC